MSNRRSPPDHHISLVRIRRKVDFQITDSHLPAGPGSGDRACSGQEVGIRTESRFKGHASFKRREVRNHRGAESLGC